MREINGIFVVFTAATIIIIGPCPRLNSGHFLLQPQQNYRSTSKLKSTNLFPAVEGSLCHAKIQSSRIDTLLELCRKVLYRDFYILQFNTDIEQW